MPLVDVEYRGSASEELTLTNHGNCRSGPRLEPVFNFKPVLMKVPIDFPDDPINYIFFGKNLWLDAEKEDQTRRWRRDDGDETVDA